MNEARVVFKMFMPPEGSMCDGIFCVYETKDSFFGYRIEKDPADYAIQIFIKKKKPEDIRYINCNELVEFPKSFHYEKLITRYKLKELRDATELIRVGKAKQRILNGKAYEIKDWGSCTEEQRKNRRNPEYHERLKKAISLRERAIMQNDKEAEKEFTKQIDELHHLLGYRERVNSGKYKKQLKDTVTNTRPLPGGACTPK